MRDYIKAVQNLMEAENDHKKSKVRDKVDDIAFDMDDGTSKGDLANPNRDVPPGRRNTQGARAKLPGRRADRTDTDNGSMGDNQDQSMRFFSHLLSRNVRDEISDAEAAQRAADGETPTTAGALPEPVTPENLPQVINKAMFDPNREGAPPSVNPPKWHMVKHLPGYMQQGIRAMGRMVFTPFTNTPIEDIQVMATMLDARDTRVMADWIQRNGMKDDEATVTAEQILPGYGADIQIWNAEDCTFMLVKDHAGSYIYGWPGGRGINLDGPGAQRYIESEDVEEEVITEKKDKPDRDVGEEALSEADLSGLTPEDMAALASDAEDGDEPETEENPAAVGGTTGTKGTVQDQQRQQGELNESDDTAEYMAKLAGVIPVPKKSLIENKDVLDLAILAGIRK